MYSIVILLAFRRDKDVGRAFKNIGVPLHDTLYATRNAKWVREKREKNAVDDPWRWSGLIKRRTSRAALKGWKAERHSILNNHSDRNDGGVAIGLNITFFLFSFSLAVYFLIFFSLFFLSNPLPSLFRLFLFHLFLVLLSRRVHTILISGRIFIRSSRGRSLAPLWKSVEGILSVLCSWLIKR